MSGFYACWLTLPVKTSGQVSAAHGARTDVKHALPPTGFYSPIRSYAGTLTARCDRQPLPSAICITSKEPVLLYSSSPSPAPPATSPSGPGLDGSSLFLWEQTPLLQAVFIQSAGVANYTLHTPRVPVNEETVKIRPRIEDFL